MIALDLVLGGKQNSTVNVCRRAAVIMSKGNKAACAEWQIKIGKLYDARSKYVHEGKEPPYQSLEELASLCALIGESLMRMRLVEENCRKDFLTDIWYKRLDYIAAAYSAGVDVRPLQFQQAGFELPWDDALQTKH